MHLFHFADTLTYSFCLLYIKNFQNLLKPVYRSSKKAYNCLSESACGFSARETLFWHSYLLPIDSSFLEALVQAPWGHVVTVLGGLLGYSRKPQKPIMSCQNALPVFKNDYLFVKKCLQISVIESKEKINSRGIRLEI